MKKINKSKVLVTIQKKPRFFLDRDSSWMKTKQDLCSFNFKTDFQFRVFSLILLIQIFLLKLTYKKKYFQFTQK